MQSNLQNNSLVVGQLKELLHEFNLPTIPVATDTTVMYPGRVYIKGSKIIRYNSDDTETVLSNYKFGVDKLNVTKNLIMNSIIYDNYTHEYLGDYLRFLRDYSNIDLMSMYNCFFNKQLDNTLHNVTTSYGTYTIDTTNSNYTWYLIPVKLNKIYTIAIDAPIKYDYCMCLYDSALVTTTFGDTLIKETFKTVPGSTFKNPYLISTSLASNLTDSIWRRESDLHMLLRLPSSVKTTITILEGNYLNSKSINSKLVAKLGCSYTTAGGEIPTILSKYSLLKLNNTYSYPFCDRLIEYLCGHAITSNENISDNIERVQAKVYTDYGYIKGYYGIWDTELRNELLKQEHGIDLTKGKAASNGKDIKIIAKDSYGNDTQLSDTINFCDHYSDITGFVDKDANSLISLLKGVTIGGSN